ncbi:MAG: hypothetical protein JWL65_2642 [Gammaproteobacteria bacterium]|nr:hypothetical protein [Gammaproteobacteria bacterium]
MLEGELQLLSGGADSLPALESLLKGEAKNRFGVPYVQLGLPLQCALEVARRLGPIAKPLEPHLREQLRRGNYTAAMALRSLGSLGQDSISQLAVSLESGGLDLAMESAMALLACGEADHPTVLEVVACSKAAARMLEQARQYHNQVKTSATPGAPPPAPPIRS